MPRKVHASRHNDGLLAAGIAASRPRSALSLCRMILFHILILARHFRHMPRHARETYYLLFRHDEKLAISASTRALRHIMVDGLTALAISQYIPASLTSRLSLLALLLASMMFASISRAQSISKTSRIIFLSHAHGARRPMPAEQGISRASRPAGGQSAISSVLGHFSVQVAAWL